MFKLPGGNFIIRIIFKLISVLYALWYLLMFELHCDQIF